MVMVRRVSTKVLGSLALTSTRATHGSRLALGTVNGLHDQTAHRTQSESHEVLTHRGKFVNQVLIC